jgi:hypothetical protein
MSNRCKLKRIRKELEKLMPWEYSYLENDNIEVMVDNYLLFFMFPEFYPFKPPTIYIKTKNGEKKEYINSFIDFRRKNRDFIKNKIKSEWCPCCNTVICNWFPGNTIHNIISEFKEYEEIKKKIINIYIIHRGNIFIDIIENNIISFLNPLIYKYTN